jgi:hypothetical protein
LVPLAFNLTTGNAHASENASARSCRNSTSSAYLDATVGFVSGTFKPSAGRHHLAARWSFTFVETLAAYPGNSTSSAFASGGVQASLCLTSSKPGSGSGTCMGVALGATFVRAGTYSHTFIRVNGTAHLTATLSSSQAYYFEVYALIQLQVSAGAGANSAFAAVKMSGPNVGTLTSVTLS